MVACSVSERLLLSGDLNRAAEAATIAAELYPASGNAQLALALTKLGGAPDEARRLARRATQLGADATNPDRLNRLAYSLAAANRLTEAIALLRIATDLQPRVANLYDSLGELSLRAGDREGARIAYRKALEIDPSWKNAEEALRGLQ